MKAAKPELIPGRRALLTGSGVLLAGGAALAVISPLPAGADPDAELLALCARAEAICRRYHEIHSDGQAGIEDDDARALAVLPLYDEEKQIAQQIFGMRATSLASHRARARLAIIYHGGFEFFKDDVYNVGADGLYVASLVRDLAGEGAPSKSTQAFPRRWPN